MQTEASSKVLLVEGVCVLKGKIVLVHHRKMGWTIPGGHVEEGETITDALKREIMEETRLRVVWMKKIAVDVYKHYEAHLFACVCEGVPGAKDPDIQEVSLFDMSTALHMVPEWQRPFLEHALKMLKNIHHHQTYAPR